MMYLLIVFVIVILIEAFIIYKLSGANKNKSIIVDESEEINKKKILSDKYLKLISKFSFSVDEICMEMKEISLKVEGVMSESEEQASNMNSISKVVEDIYSNVETNLVSSEASSKISEKTHEDIYNKIIELKDNIDELSRVRSLLDDTSSSIVDLEAKTLDAESLIGRINNISLQTNLLALNASIEKVT